MVHPARGIPPVRLLAPPWVCHPPARVHVRLLGPCFKTGRMESPERQRLERAGARKPATMWRALRSSAGATASAGQLQPALVPPRQPTLTSAPRRAADQLAPFRIRPGRTRGLHSLPSQQFQALFNSLFKVLFIFPSRYLFAIGLLPVFSLGWNLPPT